MIWPYHVRVTGHDGAVLYEDDYEDRSLANHTARKRSEAPEAERAEVIVTFRHGERVNHS